jgi:hypothetical protein
VVSGALGPETGRGQLERKLIHWPGRDPSKTLTFDDFADAPLVHAEKSGGLVLVELSPVD